MQTCINRIKQNNDHTQIMPKLQFGSSFKMIVLAHCLITRNRCVGCGVKIV